MSEEVAKSSPANNAWPFASPPSYRHTCSACRGLFLFEKQRPWRYVGNDLMYDHHSWRDLKESAATGCPLCAYLWSVARINETMSGVFVLEKYEMRANTDPDTNLDAAESPSQLQRHVGDPFGSKRPLVIVYKTHTANHPPDKWRRKFHIAFSPGSPAADAATGIGHPSRVIDVGSQYAFTAARQWLGDCLASHDLCRVPASESFMPARLLYVGDTGVGNNVRLLERASHPVLGTGGGRDDEDREKPFYVEVSTWNGPALSNNKKQMFDLGPYAALSFCWGKTEQSYQTKKENVGRPIPYTQLEKTIRDAISCTRELGLRYLWVDCLCIIQDDANDVHETISSMRHIYENATVTIVAEGSDSAEQGFLNRRPEPEKQFGLPYWADNNVGHHREDGPVVALLPMPEFQASGGTIRRAWCFEEYFLSPRRLIYGAQELRWSCLCRQNITIHPTQVSYRAFIGHASFSKRNDEIIVSRPIQQVARYAVGSVIAPSGSTGSCSKDKAYEHSIWRSCVHKYSERSLSKWRDRPQAIAGIAQSLAVNGYCLDDHGRPDEYIISCGVFRHHVMDMLAWATTSYALVPDIGPEEGSVAENVAGRFTPPPFWSWLSSRMSIFCVPILDNFAPVVKWWKQHADAETILHLRGRICLFADIPSFVFLEMGFAWDVRSSRPPGICSPNLLKLIEAAESNWNQPKADDALRILLQRAHARFVVLQRGRGLVIVRAGEDDTSVGECRNENENGGRVGQLESGSDTVDQPWYRIGSYIFRDIRPKNKDRITAFFLSLGETDVLLG